MNDPLADPNRPHMARATHMIAGIPVVVTPLLPLDHIGHAITPKSARVRRFLRWVPRRWRPRWYRVDARLEHEQFVMAAGKLFCTPAGYQLLKAGKARRAP